MLFQHVAVLIGFVSLDSLAERLTHFRSVREFEPTVSSLLIPSREAIAYLAIQAKNQSSLVGQATSL